MLLLTLDLPCTNHKSDIHRGAERRSDLAWHDNPAHPFQNRSVFWVAAYVTIKLFQQSEDATSPDLSTSSLISCSGNWLDCHGWMPNYPSLSLKSTIMERAYWTTCLPNHLQGTPQNLLNPPNLSILFLHWLSLLNWLFSPDTPEWSLIANGESFHKVYMYIGFICSDNTEISVLNLNMVKMKCFE